MNKNSKIYIAGHKGLVGGAILRLLKKAKYKNLIIADHSDLDLEKEKDVFNFLKKERPEYVFLCAALVGGIMDNKTRPGDYIYKNLKIETNVIEAARLFGAKKLLFMGSSCIYPRLAEQPIKEDYFMTGKLEPTNEAYAIAKIAGISMCQSYRTQYNVDFISIMPTNIYGPGDNLDPQKSHVIPALFRKFHDAKKNKQKELSLWGTGSAKREFLHCDDLAEASIFLMQNYSSGEIINVGTGQDVSIKELSEKIAKIVGFNGLLSWDITKPDGMPRKLLDVSKIHNLGWKHKIDLDKGLKQSYEWFKKQIK